MLKFHLGYTMGFATCVAPLFYYSICLSVLRLCLLFKALYFALRKIFTCCSDTKLREVKVFTVDFLFSVHEIFFSIAMLFSLIFMNTLDEKSANVGILLSPDKLTTIKTVWLAFALYFGIRAVILYWAMDSLSFE